MLEQQSTTDSLYGKRTKDDPEWFETHSFIRTADARLAPLKLNQVQRELHEDITGRDIIDKARKHGISTYYAARFYRKITTIPHTCAAMVAHKPDSVHELWTIVQRLYDNDPRRLKTSRSSLKEIVFPDLDSRFTVLQGTKGAGRAGTYNYLHVSELAHFNKDALETLAAMIDAVPPHNTGSEIAIESTANGEGNEFHRRWVQAVKGESEYAAHFFPWFDHPDYRQAWPEDAPPLDMEELELKKTHSLSYDQMAFRRSKIRDQGIELFAQEYPADWEESFLASGRKVFDTKALKAMQAANESEPVATSQFGRGQYINLYVKPKPNHTYIAGFDTSSGSGKDAQDMRIYDFHSMEEVAVLHLRMPIGACAEKAARLIKAYDAFIAIESNNHGHAFLEHFMNMKGDARIPLHLIYRQRQPYGTERRKIRKPGHNTNEASRPVIIKRAEQFIRHKDVLAHDPLFYQEARAFHYNEETGKEESPPGEHDDTVFAFALALEARAHKHIQAEANTQRIPGM